MQNNYEAIQALNTEIIAVTTQDLSSSGFSVEAVGIEFPLAYDVSKAVPLRWDRFGNFGTNLADASVYIIDKEGRLVWQSLGDNYQHQVSAAEIIEQLELIEG